MDTSEVILCTACFFKVKVTEDILMCSGCKLWQHRACASDIEASFYREFYLCTLLGEKPRQWMCNYCSKNTSQIKTEPDSETQSVAIPTNPPPTSQASDAENSDYSFDEFALSQEYQRETGEGLASLNSSFNISRSTPSRILNNGSLVEDQSEMSELSRLHNTAWYGDSSADEEDLNITPAALKLTETSLSNSYRFKPIYSSQYLGTQLTPKSVAADSSSCDVEPNTTGGNRTYDVTSPSRLPSNNSYDSEDSEDEMSPLKPPSIASTIPYCHSDTSFSDSEIDFPPPKRVSTAPPPTSDNSLSVGNNQVPHLNNSSDSSNSDNDNDDGRDARNPGYYTDSSEDDSDDEMQHDNRRPAYRWPSSSDSSSDSEDETAEKRIIPPTLTFQLTNGPVSGGQTILKDSHGYTYSVKFRIGVNTFWCCTEKSTRCQATAIQNRNSVTKGAADHNHIAQVFDDVEEKVAITARPTSLERFSTLKPDQDKTSGQPPKPQTEMINIGMTEDNFILVDGNGFVYYEKEISVEARQTTWKCTKKTKNGTCLGSVRIGENFLVAKNHNHVGDIKKVTELRIKAKIKSCMERNPTMTPAQIISHILKEMNLTRQSLTKAGYQALQKQVRKHKQTLK